MSGLITSGLGEDVPGSGAGFQGTSLTVSSNQILLNCTNGPPTALTGPSNSPSNWVITPGLGAVNVFVTNVLIVGNTVQLTTTNMTSSAPYTLAVPPGIMAGASPYIGPFSFSFNGVASTPNILQCRAVDARTVDVFFVTAPDPSLAGNPIHYSISPFLNVFSVIEIGVNQYRLTTSRQTAGQLYTVTWPV